MGSDTDLPGSAHPEACCEGGREGYFVYAMPFLAESFLPDLLTASLRLFLAALLGGVVGWDRKSNKKPAGLRTHMMVCLGSAAFMLFALKVFEDLKGPNVTGMDPTRIIEGIVGGIGFLGAGSIIQRGASVEDRKSV